MTRIALLIGSMFLGGAAHAFDVLRAEQDVSVTPAGSLVTTCEFAEAPGKPLRLSETVERALCNNPKTRDAWAAVKAQAAGVGVARAAYLPTVSATWQGVRENSATDVENYPQLGSHNYINAAYISDNPQRTSDFEVRNETVNLFGSNNTVEMAVDYVAPSYQPYTTGWGLAGLQTTTGSVSVNFSGSEMVLKGSAVAGTLTDGNLSVQLDNGNVATLSGVSSGTQIEYIDASGQATWTTLMDTNLVSMGGNMYSVTNTQSAIMSNSYFDVLGGASLRLSGSSNTVFLENGADSPSGRAVWITGDNNYVSATVGGWDNVSVGGTHNTVTATGVGVVGVNSFSVQEFGSANTVTVGANVRIMANGTGSTFYAMQGGDLIMVNSSGETIYGNNDSVYFQGVGLTTVRGNGNDINVMPTSGNATLNLNGSNNTVHLDDGAAVQTTTGSVSVNGNVLVLTGSAAAGTLAGGNLSLQLGNGNVATMSGVSSGTQIEYIDGSGKASWSTLTDTVSATQASQLVSAMASYSSASTGVSSTLLMQTQDNSALFASSHH
nr:TolC family protein [Caballeronia sp. TF1N1]